jgi:outer membrane protein TolC
MDDQLDVLLAQGQKHNPDLQMIRDRMIRYRKQRDLAAQARNSDLTLGISYNLVQDHGLSMAANGEDQWWLSIGATIPIWNEKLDAGEREATRGILESAGQFAAEQNRIAFEINDAFARVITQQQQIIILRDRIIPDAQRTLDAAQIMIRVGRGTSDEFIDHWRQLLSFQRMEQSMLAQLERSIADLEETLGSQVSRSTPTPPAEMNP